ncbi:MAG TPA: FAD-binding oxidoreductase [Gammaproteobacteria bacterium]
MGILDKETELTRHAYYEAGVTRPPLSAPLTGRLSADVCVVGGGYAGLAAALELAERGYRVVLLEARRLGWGASGRNGGQVLVGYGLTGQEAIEVQLPVADARRAWEISVAGVGWLRERIGRHAIDCDYTAGHLSLAIGQRKARGLERWVNHVAKHYGYQLEPIPEAELGGWIASPRFQAGAYDPLSGHLHPLKYCLGLAAAARSAGVEIFEQSAALAIERGAAPLVKTALGEIACRYVVLAGNVYLAEFAKKLAAELATRIMPVGTYIITTAPMEKARADGLIRNRAAAFDTNLVLDYFRVTADHRLLFGGGESYTTATPLNLKEKMRQRMLRVFPQLGDLQVPYVWGGFVDITMNQAPDFGRLGHNIYYLQGFSGHGLALAGMAGRLAAEALAGDAERFDLLARLKHRTFPGGERLRTPALVLGMLYYRLRDLL